MLNFSEEPVISGGDYLKIQAGQEVLVVLRGHVKTEYVVWENKKRIVSEPGAPNSKFSFRVNAVVLNPDGTINAVQVWEQGPRVYRTLKELSVDYNLEETIIKIKRTGSTMNDTVYSILPSPRKPSATLLKALAQVELHPLDDQGGSNGQAASGSDSDEELPF